MTQAPNLVVGGLHGLQDFRLAGEVDVTAKDVDIQGVESANFEPLKSSIERTLLPQRLDVLEEEVDA